MTDGSESIWLYFWRWGFRIYWFGLKIGKRETVAWVENYLKAWRDES